MKEDITNFVKENPFEFKQGIINHCRKMDKLDVYEWIAEDELKIIQLQQENQQLKEQVEYLRRSCDRKEETIIDLQFELTVIDELEKWLKEMLDSENDIFSVIRVKDILDKISELKGEENERNNN